MRRNIWWQVLMDEANPDGGGGGGGGNTPPPFDPAKFTADSDKRFKALEKQNADLLAALNGLKPKEPPVDPDPKPGDQKPDAKYKALEKQVADLKAENDKRADDLKREKRNTTLTTELGKLGIQPDRLKSAMRAVDPDIKFSEDGSLVGDDDTPVTEYLANWIKSNDHFLPPRQTGGAGASGGGRPRGEKPPQLEDIRPGMKAEDLERVRQQISNVINGK